MEETHTHIEKYLTNRMSPEEKENFEARCQEDDALAEELKMQLKIRYITRYMGDQKLKAQLNQDFDRLYAQQHGQKTVRKRWYMAAAAVILVLVVSIPFFRNYLATPSLPELVAEYKIDPPSISVLSNRDRSSPIDTLSTQDSLRIEIRELYDYQQYELVIQRLTAILDTSQHNSLQWILFFLGTAYLKNENPTMAIRSYEQIAENGIYKEEARWFTALAYLKLDQQENAIITLKQIVNSKGHYKGEKALELLKKLK